MHGTDLAHAPSEHFLLNSKCNRNYERTIVSGARDVTVVSPVAGRRPYDVTLAERAVRCAASAASRDSRAVPSASRACRGVDNAFVFIALFEITFSTT